MTDVDSLLSELIEKIKAWANHTAPPLSPPALKGQR